MTASWDVNDDGDGADDSGYDRDAAPADAHPGDESFPDQARRAYITLLTNRFITRAKNRAAWEGLLAWEHEIRARLNELYLDLVMDRDAEVAFKRQQDGDDLPRVLRRDKPLSRDASFVLLFLRREYAFADQADGPVVVTRDQIGEFLRAFRQDGDLDDARFARRVNAAIQALVKPLQLLTPDTAADYLFTVSPVIVPLVGADELQRLEATFRQAADASRTGGDTDDPAYGDASDTGNDEADRDPDDGADEDEATFRSASFTTDAPADDEQTS